jgi:hypothetical protein
VFKYNDISKLTGFEPGCIRLLSLLLCHCCYCVVLLLLLLNLTEIRNTLKQETHVSSISTLTSYLTEENVYWTSFPGVKGPGHCIEHPPPSNAEVKERIVLCLHSSSGPS